MKKLLKFLFVIQEVSNEGRELKLGARRLNPYNPLSYITVVLVLIVGILMFGFVGIWKETNLRNPFKWD